MYEIVEGRVPGVVGVYREVPGVALRTFTPVPGILREQPVLQDPILAKKKGHNISPGNH
ncbi:MAG TPA: hypothetical protein VK469_17030 [Candidatus Kapabacteria bacterium]|nr:hypothetical protein [Candidatus Kapabacteria bacterium]